jgi:RecA-family ATPase
VFIEASTKAVVPILEPILVEEEAALIFANTGVGKSFFTFGIAVAIATGTDFLGYKASKARKVQYIDGEMNNRDVGIRLVAAIGERADDDEFMKLLRENLVISNRSSNTSATEQFLDISDKNDVSEIVSTLQKNEIEVVVFDNYTTLAMSFEDENSSASFQPTLALLAQLKAVNIAPILVHHTAKNGMNYRGSTSIAIPFSSIIGLYKSSSVNERLGAGFMVQFTKSRGEYHTLHGSRVVQLNKETQTWAEVEGADAGWEGYLEGLRGGLFESRKEACEKLSTSKGTLSKWEDKIITHNPDISKEQIEEWLSTTFKYRHKSEDERIAELDAREQMREAALIDVPNDDF